MAMVLSKPGVGALSEAVGVLRQWQYDGAPMQLHPGDPGWFWRSGAEATAAAVRTWRRDGRILAVGLLDEPELLRLTTAPDAQWDEELARQLVEDGWKTAEPWTPLRRDLTETVGDPGVRIEVIGPEQAHVRTAVQRASFDGSLFTDERRHVMAAGLPYADARWLVAYDGQGNAVAASDGVGCSPGSGDGVGAKSEVEESGEAVVELFSA
jgi:hypothetical protein